MEAELKILSIIGGDNPNVTQRDLSAETNLSLGAINLLLKKMLETGLIKIEKLSTRTVRYILTPKGIMEKAWKTYDYVKRTYENILIMKNELEGIVCDLPKGGTIYLYGEDNEVSRMLTLLLKEIAEDKGITLKKFLTEEELNYNDTVIVWDNVDADKLVGLRLVNILERLM